MYNAPILLLGIPVSISSKCHQSYREDSVADINTQTAQFWF